MGRARRGGRESPGGRLLRARRCRHRARHREARPPGSRLIPLRKSRGSEGGPSLPGSRWFLAGLLVFLLGLRVAYFLQLGDSPFLEHPVFDAKSYAQWGLEIAEGNLVWDHFRIHGPGYPYFLGLLSRLTGHDLAIMTFANGFLGCAWILVFVIACRRILPHPGAEIAGGLAATYWAFLHYEGHLLATTYFLFWIVSAFYWMTSYGEDRRLRSLVLAGVALGVATVTRPNGAAALPLLLAVPLLRPVDGAGLFALRRPGRREALHAVAFGAAFATIVTPVLLRNHQLSGMFTLQHHATFNLFLGNNPEARGDFNVRPGREWDRLSSSPERAGVTTLRGHSDYFRDRVREFALEDPGAFLALQLRKLQLFLNHREIRGTLSPYFFERFAPLQASPPLLGFGVLGPIALLGLVLALREGRRLYLLYAFTVPSALLVVLTVVIGRYRVPIVPFLLAFAAYAIVELVHAARRRDARVLGVSAVLLAGFAIVVHRDFPELDHENFGEEMARVAWVYESRGETGEAARWWALSFEADPSRIDSYVGYARLALLVGDVSRAEEVTRAGLARRPEDVDLLTVRGRALLLAGAPREALGALTEALEQNPEDPDLLADVARAHADLARPDSSRHYFRRAIAGPGERPGVLADAARVLLEIAAGETGPSREEALSEARQYLERAARLNPKDRELALQLEACQRALAEGPAPGS